MTISSAPPKLSASSFILQNGMYAAAAKDVAAVKPAIFAEARGRATEIDIAGLQEDLVARYPLLQEVFASRDLEALYSLTCDKLGSIDRDVFYFQLEQLCESPRDNTKNSYRSIVKTLAYISGYPGGPQALFSQTGISLREMLRMRKRRPKLRAAQERAEQKAQARADRDAERQANIDKRAREKAARGARAALRKARTAQRRGTRAGREVWESRSSGSNPFAITKAELVKITDPFEREVLEALPALYSFARSLVGHRENAEDYVLWAMEKAFLHRDSYELGTKIKAWLFTITRNLVTSEARRDWRMSYVDPQDFQSSISSFVNPAQQYAVELHETEDRIIAALPPEQREAILLAAKGFSYEEMAQTMGCAVGTAKSRVSRARRRARFALDPVEALEAAVHTGLISSFDDDKAALLLSDTGMESREMAKVLACTPATAEARASRARRQAELDGKDLISSFGDDKDVMQLLGLLEPDNDINGEDSPELEESDDLPGETLRDETNIASSINTVDAGRYDYLFDTAKPYTELDTGWFVLKINNVTQTSFIKGTMTSLTHEETIAFLNLWNASQTGGKPAEADADVNAIKSLAFKLDASGKETGIVVRNEEGYQLKGTTRPDAGAVFPATGVTGLALSA